MKHPDNQSRNLAINPKDSSYKYEVRIGEHEAKLHSAEYIGAVFVRRGVQNQPRPQFEVTDTLRTASDRAISVLKEKFKPAETSLQLARKPTAQTTAGHALAAFNTLALRDATELLELKGADILGGVAVFESARGFSAGLFSHHLVSKAFAGRVMKLRADQKIFEQGHELVPPVITDMIAEFPLRNGEPAESNVAQSVGAVIARYLPSEEALEIALRSDQRQVEAYLPDEVRPTLFAVPRAA